MSQTVEIVIKEIGQLKKDRRALSTKNKDLDKLVQTNRSDRAKMSEKIKGLFKRIHELRVAKKVERKKTTTTTGKPSK